MPVEWSRAAVADLKTIYDYFEQHDSRIAARTFQAIRSKAALLESFPALGSPFDQTVRRLSVPRTSHLILYVIRPSGVFVVRVFDSRQDWQNWTSEP